MPDETGPVATSSDTPSVDESLFGGTTGDTPEAVEEEDSNTETDRNENGSEDAEEQAGQPEDLKGVVSLKGGRATIGAQRTASYLYIESFGDRDLPRLAQETLAVLERARAKWEDEPRYPAHVRTAPQARCRPRREQGAAQAIVAEGDIDQQQPQTLRLFYGRARPCLERRCRWPHLLAAAICPPERPPASTLLHLCGQRTPRRRGPGAAANAALLGRVHRRGAD